MPSHPLRDVIDAADRAIAAENFDGLMEFYADDAALVVTPGLIATGKAQILKAFSAIAERFGHCLKVSQREMEVVEGADTALVLAETVLETEDADGQTISIARRGTYVFRKTPEGDWLCAVDNSYGTGLLGR